MNLAVLIVVVLMQWLLLAAIMAGAWVIQQRTRNSGYVDAIWTFGLGAVGVLSALAPLHDSDAVSARQALVAVVMSAWALRLGTHIMHRSAARGDDPRYAALIRKWGTHASRQMFLLLQKQVIVTLPLALAIFVAAHNPAPLFRVLDVLAVVVVLTAVAGEAVADRQLRAFRESPARDAVCDRGLWGWSRHPNYFFEWLFWLAMPLLAIDFVGAYPYGWVALAAPVCMYWLLVFVSGIPPLEEHMLKKHGAAYRAYQARTSAFFPMPPEKPA